MTQENPLVDHFINYVFGSSGVAVDDVVNQLNLIFGPATLANVA